MTLTNASGQPVPLLPSFDGQDYFAPLVAGTYTVGVSGWSAGQSASVSYDLTIDIVGQQDNAPPLVTGPTPLIQIVLDSAVTGTPGAATAGLSAGSGLSSPVNAGTGAGPGLVASSVSIPSAVNFVEIEFAGGAGEPER